ncbi:MAG TPA: cytochrome c oxidase subunit I [Lentisphaeria bacterium]|nr:cytochrome c oxidase subunit I [Lentisphaeria bacterium]
MSAADSNTNYINHTKGIMSWLLTVDHKRIGLMYMIVVLSAFAAGGFFAVAIRLELFAPEMQIFPAAPTEGASWTYNKAFTLHGAIMVFLFIIPSIPAILGNFCLPIMLGTKDVAFPRLNLASWYIYMIGAAICLYAIFFGNSVDTGWTFYTPYSTSSSSSVTMMTFGVFVLGFSSILTGMNFVVTVHKMRAPGMGWFEMPLFVWGIYATALIQILATPVLAITLLLLIMETTFGIGIFDPANGGDPVLFQHFFWFYSHPAVYIMILPGMAVMSELIAVHSHRTIFGYKLIAYSSVAIAFLGFLVWGHHMFVSGQSEFISLLFSFITFLIGVPTAIKLFNWMTTMYLGQISWNTPMLYALCFMVTFTIGGLTGVFLGALGMDIPLHDTYFVVAHFHYVMMGGTVIAFLGGLHHWWPKIFGKMYSEFWGKIGFVFIFLGFNMTFFSQFILGQQGMPRRYADYAGFEKTQLFETYHQFSTVGSLILAVGFIIILIYLVHSLIAGKKAPANPWGGLSMEWATSSPPPAHNFLEDPVCKHGPYDYDKVRPEDI